MNTTLPSFRSPIKRLRDTPLALVTDAYRQRLDELGYSSSTQSHYIGGIAHFAVWMKFENISLNDINPDVIVRFIQSHLPVCQCPGKVQRRPYQVRAALQQLMPVLQDAGFTQVVSKPDQIQIELNRFDEYLRDYRGLASNTRRQRLTIVGDLLRSSIKEDQQIGRLDVSLLRAFMNDRLERWSPTSCAVAAGALRAYLRFRALNGDDVKPLLPVIGSPACWKLSSLPETINDVDIERLLHSFNAPLPSRYRGVAIAQCVARLGLRASEVVGLELDDIDWQVGTLRLRRCKSRRVDIMPMPKSVGSAIADYLCNERPTCDSRRVFVRHVAPVEVPIKPSLVGRVMRDAYLRCNLPYSRVHIFRHSLASSVLDNGGTLKEVADILRHRSLDTAQIYAKLDERRLSDVTMPWPGVKS